MLQLGFKEPCVIFSMPTLLRVLPTLLFSLVTCRQTLTFRMSSAMFKVLLALACLVSFASTVPSPVDLHVERLGVPFPSWFSPVYSNPTLYNENPHLTRATHLSPRFHRFLRYGKDINSKSQTAIMVAGRSADDEDKGKQGASVISALNPRNGETGEGFESAFRQGNADRYLRSS